MNQKERNARLLLPPDACDPAIVRRAQFLFLVSQISRRGLTANSRQELLRIIEGMDAEVQEIAGLQTAAQREAVAERWDHAMFLMELINAGAQALIERTGPADEEFILGEVHPDADRAQEILHQRGVIGKETTPKMIKSNRLAAIVFVAALIAAIVGIVAFGIALSRGILGYRVLAIYMIAVVAAISGLVLATWLIVTELFRSSRSK